MSRLVLTDSTSRFALAWIIIAFHGSGMPLRLDTATVRPKHDRLVSAWMTKVLIARSHGTVFRGWMSNWWHSTLGKSKFPVSRLSTMVGPLHLPQSCGSGGLNLHINQYQLWLVAVVLWCESVSAGDRPQHYDPTHELCFSGWAVSANRDLILWD